MHSLEKTHRFLKLFGTNITRNTYVRSNVSSSNLPTLTLYTKEQCTLCDEAKEKLEPFDHMYHFEEVDIQKIDNRKWLKYRYDIPVFHLNGQFLMKHKADITVLLRALEKLEKRVE